MNVTNRKAGRAIRAATQHFSLRAREPSKLRKIGAWEDAGRPIAGRLDIQHVRFREKNGKRCGCADQRYPNFVRLVADQAFFHGTAAKKTPGMLE